MNNMKTIQALKVEPGKLPEAVTLPNTLEALRETVGGYLDAVCLERGVYLLCSQDGKYTGLPDNRTLNGDTIAGTFLIVGEENGLFCSIGVDKLIQYAERFALPELADHAEYEWSWQDAGPF